jgi:hypothetical protein
LNGIGTDNRRVNLAYVPESDPRPAAPLKAPPPGLFDKTVATRNSVTRKKKRKGKKKRH